MTHLFLLHLASVKSITSNLYQNYLRPWGPEIGLVAVAVGGLTYVVAGMVGSATHGANGLTKVMYAIVGVVIVYSAADLIAIATGVAK